MILLNFCRFKSFWDFQILFDSQCLCNFSVTFGIFEIVCVFVVSRKLYKKSLIFPPMPCIFFKVLKGVDSKLFAFP